MEKLGLDPAATFIIFAASPLLCSLSYLSVFAVAVSPAEDPAILLLARLPLLPSTTP